MRLIIGTASCGRPETLTRNVIRLQEQTRRPDRVVISAASEADVNLAALQDLSVPVEVHFAEGGLARQRNAILDLIAADDLLLFIDDDFLLANDYCEALCGFFAAQPEVAMVTGNVLADGIRGPGLSFDAGLRIIHKADRIKNGGLRTVYNGYGCNMAVRAGPVVKNGLRFDERLPLYCWLEDVDFSRQLADHGRIVQAQSLQGVHLGIKQARSPGIILGYSQVANPLYLASKGTMARHRATMLMIRNIIMNIARSFRPEPWVDRRGRLRGNLLAFGDLFAGRLCPERATAIK